MFVYKLYLDSMQIFLYFSWENVWKLQIGPLSGDVSGKFTTSTDKQEGGVSRYVCHPHW